MATPTVFLSYSHDSPEHRNWVINLAEKLMAHGVDVILDMWELGPGDDISAFMERGLAKADRVVMVCTPNYLAKAQAGKGGVGYEKTIMTAEYMKSMDSKRVIPIIRQTGAEMVPSFLGTKKYLDFSTDDRVEFNFDELVRELHGRPLFEKPALGAAPNFDTTPPVEPKLADDPVMKVMRVFMAAYEDLTSNSIEFGYLIHTAKEQGMSRTYFESMFKLVLDKGFVTQGEYQGEFALTVQGRNYALVNKLA